MVNSRLCRTPVGCQNYVYILYPAAEQWEPLIKAEVVRDAFYDCARRDLGGEGEAVPTPIWPLKWGSDNRDAEMSPLRCVGELMDGETAKMSITP
jgi:hypothetical protein